MTLTEMLAEARSQLNEPTAGFWSDAELTRWINQGQLELITRARWKTQDATFSTTASVREYVISGSINNLRRVEYDDRPIDRKTWEDFDNIYGTQWRARTSTGTPTYYYLRDGVIGFMDTPDAVKTVRLIYYRDPLSLVSGVNETPEVPAAVHLGMVEWALWMANRKSGEDVGDESQGQKALARFGEYVSRLRVLKKQSELGAKGTAMRWMI